MRSKSDHSVVAENRAVLHKIGVTGGSVERRIANARLGPTSLMADGEIVATYELYNITGYAYDPQTASLMRLVVF